MSWPRRTSRRSTLGVWENEGYLLLCFSRSRSLSLGEGGVRCVRWRSLTSFCLFVVVVAFVGTKTCYVQFRMITRNLHACVCVRRSYGTRSQTAFRCCSWQKYIWPIWVGSAWNQEGVET
uniref:(northern house mosquito) hypothetical protein n=1 Tax=Culex pipiens TaxID=7175 RepID=A0A8D8GZW0_CULPI